MKKVKTRYFTPKNDVNRLIKYEYYEGTDGRLYTKITYYRRDYAPGTASDEQGVY